MQSVLPDLSKLVPTAGRNPPAWPGKGAGPPAPSEWGDPVGKGGKGKGKSAAGKGAGGKGAGGKGAKTPVQPGQEEVHDFDWALREFDRIDQEKREREARDAAKHSQLLQEERFVDAMQQWGELTQQLPGPNGPDQGPPEEVEELVQSKPPPGRRETPSERMARELRELREQRGRQRQEQQKQEKKEKERQDNYEWQLRKQEYEERRRMAFQPRR